MADKSTRPDGRRADELRPVQLTLDYVDYPEGSVLIELGHTRVLCNVSVEETVPAWMAGRGGGWLTAEYALLPRSTHTRNPRETTGLRGRTQEIRRLIGRSLRAAVNLDLLASEYEVAAGREGVGVARSARLPQIDLSGSAVILDEKQAAASFGQAAERTFTGTAGFRQILFSDDVWTNVDVQRKLQLSREKLREKLRLDIAQSAATAYLNVLRAKTAERVQIEASVRAHARTGEEMEALVAVAAAGLTIYDMCKAVDRGMTVEAIRLVSKSGGKSGPWRRPGEEVSENE